MNWTVPKMKSMLGLSRDEARTYSKILDTISKLPKSDPRFVLVIGMTWWLLHRRRRMEQQRMRRRQFFRRWRRLVLLRGQIRQTNHGVGFSASVDPGTPEEFDYDEEEAQTVPDIKMPCPKPKMCSEGLREMRTCPENPSATPPPPVISKIETKLPEDFWNKVEAGQVSSVDFLNAFHMSQEVFHFIYESIADQLNENCMEDDESSSNMKNFAAIIYSLATNAEYSKLANAFGIDSPISSLLLEACQAIITKFKDDYLCWNMSDDPLDEKIAKSEMVFGIPQCVGVVGSVGIFLNKSDSKDGQEQESLILQAVVDHDFKISHIFQGDPCLSNADLLQGEDLGKIIDENFGIEMTTEVNNVRVPVLIVGEASFPLEDWLMTPYINLQEDRPEDEGRFAAFNEKISLAENKFKETMRKLKGRWNILNSSGNISCYSCEDFANIAMTCCILHNICERRGDAFEAGWINVTNDVIRAPHQSVGKKSSQKIRDILANRIFEKNVLLNCFN